MGKHHQFKVVDGPLAGELYMVELTVDGNLRVRLKSPEGLAWYTAKKGRPPAPSGGATSSQFLDPSGQLTREYPFGLWFMGYEAPIA